MKCTKWWLLPLCAVACVLTAAAVSTAGGAGAPIPQELEFETCKNVAYEGRLSATDPEGDLITFQLTDKPARGSVELKEDGSGVFVYTPFENKTGKDSFTFVAVDANGNVSAPSKVKLRIRKPSTKVKYADMEGEASHNAAIKLAEEKVMVGEKIGDAYYFRPQETVSRSQFIAMAMSALDKAPLEDVTTTGFADDEAIPTWAKGYVSAALQGGVVRGYPEADGRVVFAPGAAITRGEAAVMLDKLLDITDVSVTTFYPDTAAAPAWAFQSAVNLESAGVMTTNAAGALALEDTLTRGEAAELLAGALEVVEARETTGWFRF